VTVVASVTTVTETSVDTLVSVTTSVATAVSVTVLVAVSLTVVTGRVTVVGWGFRQLQALESFQDGCWSRFFLVKSTQLGAGVDTTLVIVGTRFLTVCPPPVTVVVTVTVSWTS
jgi:hypothetical protein